MNAQINDQVSSHTVLPWECKPHIMDSSHKCNCTSWCEEFYAGGILSVHVSNGIPLVSEGGNDAPPFEEAKANAIFIDRAIHAFYPMFEALSFCIKSDGSECLGDHPAQLAKARAAIAKALGEDTINAD